MIQCNISVICVTGPASLALMTNRAGVWICRTTHAKYINDVKLQCVIVKKAVYVIL